MITFEDLKVEQTWFEKNQKQIKIGLEGEGEVRKWIGSHNFPLLQIDAMFKCENKWYCAEIKTQEKYVHNPFDGHGLSMPQIQARLSFCKDTNTIPVLMVRCLDDNVLYYEDLRKLMRTRPYTTKGNTPRVIFNLKYFKIGQLI